MINEIDWSQCPELERFPGKVSGSWLFRGTRVPVSAVLMNLKDLSVDEVIAEFPSVSKEHVRAVMDFMARSVEAATAR